VVRCHRTVVASSDNAPRLHPRIRVEKGVGGLRKWGWGLEGGGDIARAQQCTGK
jgi:hypothetical protein